MQKEGASMSPKLRRKTRGLLILFLLLYAAFTLIPGAVYGAYQLQQQKGNTLKTSPSPQSSLPPTASVSPSPSPQPDLSAAPSPSSQPASSSVPGFLDGQTLPSSTPAGEDVFTLYDTATGNTFQVSASEFLPAALACEMDLSAPDEALKAQAVALYTFYSYQRAQNQEEAADFACDTENWLVYVPQSAMEERWGENFSTYYQKLQSIVESIEGQLLTWEGEPICAAFFAISGGNTESALNVWGTDFPYLQAAASPGDCFSNGYLSTVSLTAEELRQAALGLWEGEVDFSGPEEEWITEVEASSSGYVNTAKVGGRNCTGEELREAFGLRSACFQVAYSDGVFQFTVRGWGHGVGMSQAGAMFLAEQGAGYQEILAHFYPGSTLEQK